MDNCIFCKIIKGEIPAHKVYEDKTTLAFLDISPVNIGHTLVIPKEHYINIYETPENIMMDMMKTVKKISHAIKKGLDADGINVAMNNEGAAGQVVFHSHIHVIPRIKNDGFGLWHGKRPYKKGEEEMAVKKITQKL
ncbi:MAG: HIT family protein [Candidatus Nomurabacteria bacterium]|nr:HIT family protein [Candidatus Nomurabacteria bacterium]